MSSSGALCWMQVQHRRCWQQTDRRTDKRITPSLKVLFLSGAGLITTRVSCILTSSDCNSKMFSRNASYILRLLKALFNTIRRNVFLFFVATNNNSHVRHAPSSCFDSKHFTSHLKTHLFTEHCGALAHQRCFMTITFVLTCYFRRKIKSCVTI